MKKYIIGVVVGALLMCAIPSVAESVEVSYNKIKVQINGAPVTADNVLIGGRTYVPLRAIGEILSKDVIWDAATSTANIRDKGSVVAAPNTNIEEFKLYLVDIQEQTHRTISDNQQKLIMDYVGKNAIIKLDANTLTLRRADFDKRKKSILLDWETNNGIKWPTYASTVLGSTGKTLRSIGSNYDAHHIIELSYGGPNEWWNMWPAAYPNEHQGGIHRADGPVSKLFDSED